MTSCAHAPDDWCEDCATASITLRQWRQAMEDKHAAYRERDAARSTISLLLAEARERQQLAYQLSPEAQDLDRLLAEWNQACSP